MHYSSGDPVFLSRDVEVVAIPAGHTVTLPKSTEIIVTQALGGTTTLMVPTYGGLFRLANKDADAIGKEVLPEEKKEEGPLSGEALEQEVWQRLKTCYDPEIPVNIVDLGLVYSMKISTLEDSASRIDIQMTLTAQGCGMGGSIAADAQNKLLEIPGVKEADVQIVSGNPSGLQKRFLPKAARFWELSDREGLCMALHHKSLNGAEGIFIADGAVGPRHQL